MKFILKVFIIISLLFTIGSCSKMNRHLLPNSNSLKVDSRTSFNLIAYDVKIFMFDKYLEIDKLEQFPKNIFYYGYCSNCSVTNWTNMKKIPKNQLVDILNKLKKANNISNNSIIRNLCNHIENNKEMFYYSDYKSDKYIYYFYILNVEEKLIYEFELNW